MPKGFNSFSEGLRAITETFHALKTVLKNKGLSTAVGDEGVFAPKLESTEAAIEAILQAVKDAGYTAGKQIFLALDVAASEFYNGNGTYTFKKSTGEKVTGDEIVDIWAGLVAKYPIVSIEDGCGESDWATWKNLTDKLGDKVQLVGDDLFVTNVKFLQKGIDTGTEESEELCSSMAVQELKDYLEYGTVTNSVNFPTVESVPSDDVHTRLIMINRDVPGMIGFASQKIGAHGINIPSYLNASNGSIGYNIIDLGSPVPESVVKEIAAHEGVIRTRTIVFATKNNK